MYRDTDNPKKQTTKIGENDGKSYVGIVVIICVQWLICSKRYKYCLVEVCTTVNHG